MGQPRTSHGRHIRTPQPALLSLVALGIVAAAVTGSPAWAHSSAPRAHAARILHVRDEGRLHYVKSSGEQIIDEGHATGSFPGWVKVRFLYNGEPNVSARFTIYGSGGSVSARATARLSSPTSPSPSFHGSMTITGGSGRYAHVHGGGELYGVYYRRSYALTVQAIGKLPY
ncbi:MAG TPA: hypothetical protein VGX26_02770 [Solirubrobacteraceae bacterium]|nr:hypothetical protein [Solirubrobacteraceae bacterium]